MRQAEPGQLDEGRPGDEPAGQPDAELLDPGRLDAESLSPGRVDAELLGAGQVGAGQPGAGRAGVGRPPVMADVAKLAGVSHQTVSRVLNDHPNVRPQTRDRVLAVIRQLAYRPNAAARTLVTRRTRTLGVICIDSTMYGPASMLYGIEQAARHSYFISIASLPALNRRSMLGAVDRFLGQAVEGIIVIAPQTTAVAALSHVPAEVPLVAVGCGTHASLASVAIDNAGGAALATRYMLGLGHKTVHHLAGLGSWLDARERIEGWRRELQAAGVPEPPMLSGDWTAASGYKAAHELAAMPEATAVFCANDQMALGLLRALFEQGRRVPEDISVIGFDDIPESAYFVPPLTTIRQDFGKLGRRALDRLLRRIGDAQRGTQTDSSGPWNPIAPELVIRSSTSGPAG
jgi:DNA-binding LacI/PurR family transcriptional regulator